MSERRDKFETSSGIELPNDFNPNNTQIDFENEKFVVDVKETAILPWDATPTAVVDLANAVTANSTHPLFLALGIAFYQQVNGQMYPLKNGAFNALALIKVNGV